MRQPDSDRVEVSTRSSASPDIVWRALTHERAAWWPDMAFDTCPGASLRETWDEGGVTVEATGFVVTVEPPTQLTFRWTQPDWPNGYSTVAIEIVADEAGSLITLVETGLARATGDRASLHSHDEGWRYHLDRLVRSSERSQEADDGRRPLVCGDGCEDNCDGRDEATR